jgi:hypothetical protein
MRAGSATPADLDGFALGYRIHNSMFGRQLLHLWTYVLRREDRVKLKDFAALLNNEAAFRDPATGELLNDTDDGWFCNGFDAAFVGATAEDGFADLMRDRLVDDFLPLDQVDPDACLPGLDEVKFREFIPPEAMAQLYDDMRIVRQPGSRSMDFKGLFVEIAKDGDGIKVVSPLSFSRKMPPEHPITASVEHGFVTGTVDASPEKPKAPDGPLVPWRAFANAITSLAEAKGWFGPSSVSRQIPSECFDFAEDVLRSLNGPLPQCWSFVGLFSGFAHVNQGKEEEFRELITALFNQIVRCRADRAERATAGRK